VTVSATDEEQETGGGVLTSYKNAPTGTVSAGGVDFAYRELGPKAGVPVIFLVHLVGNLDNWDSRVVDGIAALHRVITFDNRGVGASTGKTPDTMRRWPRTPSRSSARWGSARSIFTGSRWAA
jgi:pimeloyl-ACP methyl ester carboxylesterase